MSNYNSPERLLEEALDLLKQGIEALSKDREEARRLCGRAFEKIHAAESHLHIEIREKIRAASPPRKQELSLDDLELEI